MPTVLRAFVPFITTRHCWRHPSLSGGPRTAPPACTAAWQKGSSCHRFGLQSSVAEKFDDKQMTPAWQINENQVRNSEKWGGDPGRLNTWPLARFASNLQHFWLTAKPRIEVSFFQGVDHRGFTAVDSLPWIHHRRFQPSPNHVCRSCRTAGVTFLTAGSVDGAVKAFDLRSLHLPAPPRSTSQRRTPSGVCGTLGAVRSGGLGWAEGQEASRDQEGQVV